MYFFAFIFGISLFHIPGIQAHEIKTPLSQANSQTITLLRPYFSTNIPQSIGGPDTIVSSEYALKSVQNWQEHEDINKKGLQNKDGLRTYVVQEGDNLSKIADSYNISVDTIKWENNLSKNTIRIGQELRILPETGVRHTIIKGDTLAKLANTYEVEVSDIKDNTPQNLKVGEKVFIKGGKKKRNYEYKKSVKKSSASKKRGYTSSKKIAHGEYLFPVRGGHITSGWGRRWGGFHYGVDIGAPVGTSIVAAKSGVVIKTVTGCRVGARSCGGGYGNYVVIKHSNGTKTLYGHMSTINVSHGSKVKAGERIGGIGNTGRSTGPHTHFEIENIRTGKKIRPQF